MKGAIIAIDLDGTLLDSNQEIRPRTLNALLRIQEKGCRIILSSGRPTESIDPYARQLRLEQYGGFIMSYNGALITDCHSGYHVCQHLLSPTLYPMLYERGNCGPFRLLCYLDGHVASEDIENPYVMRSSQRNRLPLMRLQSFLSQVTRPLPKCLIVGDPDKIARLETEMKAEDKYSGISIYRSEPYFLEVVPAGIDKAASLSYLFSQLGIEREQLMAFGDGYNDLSMIAWAGTGIAMANACPEVKRAAKLITLSNDDDGIAHALAPYLL